jgi:hypothetical protein
MKKLDAGLHYNNYISSVKIRNVFKDKPFSVDLKNIVINGQRRGCSGFITNNETNKCCYITTEPFWTEIEFPGFCGNIMMRAASSTKDYCGGINHWIPATREAVLKLAYELTK